MTFSEWLNEVDRHLEARLGLGHRYLPDYFWRDMYDDEVDPEDAVADYIDEGAYL